MHHRCDRHLASPELPRRGAGAARRLWLAGPAAMVVAQASPCLGQGSYASAAALHPQALAYTDIFQSALWVLTPLLVLLTLAAWGWSWRLKGKKRRMASRQPDDRQGVVRQWHNTIAELGLRALRTDLNTFMHELLLRLQETLDVEYCKVLELGPDGEQVHLRAGVGWPQDVVIQTTVDVGASQARYTLRSDTPIIIEDWRTESRFAGPALLHEHGLRSGMSVVLGGTDESFGVLGIDTRRKRCFTEDDARFLQAGANVLAAAIQRRRVEDALRESEQRYAIAIRSAQWGLWDYERSTNQVNLSSQFAALRGYEAENTALDAEAVLQMIHPEDRPAVRQQFEAHLQGQSPLFESEHRLRDAGGQWKWMLVSGKVVERDERGAPLRAAGTFKDIDARKRAEQALTARARQQAAVSELGQRALSGAPVPQLMNEAVQQVARTLNVEFCKVLELMPRGDKLLLIAGVGWDADEVGAATVPNAPHSQENHTLLSRGPIIVEDWSSEPRFQCSPLLLKHNVLSGLNVVIDGGDKPYGVLGVHAATRRVFTADDVHFVQSVANVLADAVRQTRTAEALRESEMHYRQAAESNRRLLHEVNHRVRNNLAGLMSLLSLTRQRATDVQEFARAMESRINAMARTHNLLADSGWRPLDMGTLVNNLLTFTTDVAPHAIEVHVQGPPTPISPRQSVPLAMSLIELFTNSGKHGAHRSPAGRLSITWCQMQRQGRTWVRLNWRESGGPRIEGPITASLGTELIQGFISFQLGGQCELRFPPDGADHVLAFMMDPAPTIVTTAMRSAAAPEPGLRL